MTNSSCARCPLVGQKEKTLRSMVDRARHLEKELGETERERRELQLENAQLKSRVRELEGKVRRFG